MSDNRVTCLFDRKGEGNIWVIKKDMELKHKLYPTWHDLYKYFTGPLILCNPNHTPWAITNITYGHGFSKKELSCIKQFFYHVKHTLNESFCHAQYCNFHLVFPFDAAVKCTMYTYFTGTSSWSLWNTESVKQLFHSNMGYIETSHYNSAACIVQSFKYAGLVPASYFINY